MGAGGGKRRVVANDVRQRITSTCDKNTKMKRRIVNCHGCNVDDEDPPGGKKKKITFGIEIQYGGSQGGKILKRE